MALGYRRILGSGGQSLIEPDEFVLSLTGEARAMQVEGRSLRTILLVLGPRGLVNRHGRRLSAATLMRVLAMNN